MKKILGIAVGIMLLLSAVNVFAVSGAVYVGDDSAEMMFTGSVSSHYLLLSSNGVLSAWGDNTYGQCGAPACDTLTDINYIDFDDKIVKVSAGNEFSLALDENNTVWGWGNNSEGQLGISRTEDSSQQYFDTPQKITDNITDIAAGEGFSVFLTDSGEVLLSGMNKTLDTIDFPERNGEKPKIKLIAAGYDNVAAVDENNVVYYLKADIGKTEITELPENETVQAAAVGMEHLVFKCLNGDNTDIYTYGDNTKYQLGTGSTELTDAPVKTLSLPRSEYENVNVNVYAGKYNTVVNAWNNMSFYDNVTEYTWGTDCCRIDDGVVLKETAAQPELYPIDHNIIAIGADKYMAFDYMLNEITIFGNDGTLGSIPLIEPAEDIPTLYEYQYADVPYNTYKVNFVKLNEETFPNENNDKYSYWEFVNEHRFRVKVKDFVNGFGNSTINPAISSVMLSKEATGENRVIGTYGPTVWNFKYETLVFKTNECSVEYGSENGTVIPLTTSRYYGKKLTDLYISKDTPVFYEEPDKICEETLLGLYVYGLPDGVKASVRWNSEDQPEIELIGNSSESRENETQIKICFVHVSNDTNVKGKIGDYDLNDTIMCVSYCSIEGFTIGSDVGDDRSCYKIEEINLSQNGEVTDEIPDASGFTAEVRFNKTKERTASDTLCLAVYDTDGRFMYIDSLKARFAKDFDYSFGFDVPEQESSIGAIKAFVWSGYDSLTPLGNSKELIN